MSKDILDMYGSNSSQPQAAVIRSGGVMEAKPIPYSPPKGPSNVGDAKSPGLHGSVHPCGSQRG